MNPQPFYIGTEGDELAIREAGQPGTIAHNYVGGRSRDRERIEALVIAANACAGIPTQALKDGVITAMFEALHLSLRFVESVEALFAAADRAEEADHAREFKAHVTHLISLAYGERFREGLKLRVLELLAAGNLSRAQLETALPFDPRFVLGDLEHERLIVGDSLDFPPGNRKFAITNRGFATLEAAKAATVGGAS